MKVHCGKYGFYESIDYTKSRLKNGEEKEVVKTYMAHHQGLILLSINNFINNKILIERFYENPEIEAIDILLQERMPQKAIVTKEKKEKVEKLKIRDYQNYSERVYTKVNKDMPTSNVISTGSSGAITLIVFNFILPTVFVVLIQSGAKTTFPSSFFSILALII